MAVVEAVKATLPETALEPRGSLEDTRRVRRIFEIGGPCPRLARLGRLAGHIRWTNLVAA